MGRRMGFAAIIAISLMALGSALAASGNGLASGEFMWSRIVSNNGLYHLEYQDDGNLVTYEVMQPGNWLRRVWSSMTGAIPQSSRLDDADQGDE